MLKHNYNHVALQAPHKDAYAVVPSPRMKRGKPSDIDDARVATFRAMVDRLLREKRFTKVGLGKRLGLSGSAVSQWEKKNRPSHSNLEALRAIYVAEYGYDDLTGPARERVVELDGIGTLDAARQNPLLLASPARMAEFNRRAATFKPHSPLKDYQVLHNIIWRVVPIQPCLPKRAVRK